MALQEPFVATQPLARRTLVGGLATLGVAALVRPALAAPPQDVQFKVFREGSEIGTHRVGFRPTPGGFDVDVSIQLQVKIAFITVFRYSQTARDNWQDGNLVAAEYQTDDDGKRSTVRVRQDGSRLRVEGSAGSFQAPLGTMTDLSFWNLGIMQAPQLVDSQTGQIGTLKTGGRSADRLVIGGREVMADRYTVSGSQERAGRIWYVERQWVKASFVTRGQALEYVLA